MKELQARSEEERETGDGNRKLTRTGRTSTQVDAGTLRARKTKRCQSGAQCPAAIRLPPKKQQEVIGKAPPGHVRPLEKNNSVTSSELHAQH